MTVIVFRHRLAPDAPESYGPRALEIFGYAHQMPGFRSFKLFGTGDGELVGLIEFESDEHSRAWGRHAEHRKAQREGRELYYSEFSLQICEPVRESRFERAAAGPQPAVRSARAARGIQTGSEGGPPMALIVFRTRMALDAPASYGARAEEIYGYAVKMPGFVSIKDFVAEDGERLAIVEFETEAHSRAWGQHAEHMKAQQEGRDLYYSEYSLQVCEVVRESRFARS